MKVCTYCNATNDDDAKACTSCGGNSFKNKCGNCGTVFDSGLYCPKCGVKTGSIAKKCSNCGTEYFSNACPNCGYISGNNQNADNTTAVFPNVASQPIKKRKTWLWVLGWIFIFPVPLTILMLRNKKLNKGLRIGIIIAVWLVYLLIGFSGGNSSDNNNNTSEPVSSIENSDVQTSGNSGQTVTTDEATTKKLSIDTFVENV